MAIPESVWSLPVGATADIDPDRKVYVLDRATLDQHEHWINNNPCEVVNKRHGLYLIAVDENQLPRRGLRRRATKPPWSTS